MREKLDFNTGWKFCPEDQRLDLPPFKDPMYLGAKTERELRGYASADYGKNREMMFGNWKSVTLPHDFIIEQEPKKENNNTLGYFTYHNGWYRKSFKVEESDRGRRLALYFEGIATHATVYFNGCLMAHNFCGFTPFEVDITDMVKYGQENVVAVYVNTTDQHEGWWYSGGGIYRKVWLVKTESVSIDLWGVYVHPEKLDGMPGWRLPVTVTFRNDTAKRRKVKTFITIHGQNSDYETDDDGGLYGTEIQPKDKTTGTWELDMDHPRLWSIEDPYLYTCNVHIFDYYTNEELDSVSVKFGFRTLKFDANKGFFLNGKPTKIKGVCCHEDYGLQGKAISDSVKRYRLELLKDMGANAYRCSHYQQSEYTFECLAELGYLVMAETRWFESTKEGLEQLEALIKCHRNNPAVIMWSLGNEEPLHNNDIGKRIFVTMREKAKRWDDTRPFTTAVSNNPGDAPVNEEVDIIGVNYNLWDYDKLHEKFPEKMIFASECCAVGSTRGWTYDDNPKRGYLHCYDNRTGWFMSREATWKFICEREWLAGGFQWAGIEHRGETEWPRLCSQSGALDMFLQKKDAFYENKAHWTSEPVVHIYPHWNLPDRIGETIRVWVYTNCDEIELIQDGNIIGKVQVEKYGHAEFDVTYAPGKLEAKGYRDGKFVGSDIVETTGAPVRLELELMNRHELKKGDAAIVNCYALDEDGKRVPDASPFVKFDINGGTIVGTGSDIADHTPVPVQDRKMRAGIIAVCAIPGESCTIYAKADGLEPARIKIPVKG